MNFFAYQDSARKKTVWLVIGFFLCIVAIILLIDAIIWFLRFSNYFPQFEQLYQQNVFWFMRLDFINLCLCIIILSGSLVKYLQLKAGGASIATLLAAKHVDRDSDLPTIRQLYNVVDEMSIASGIIAPMIFVLDKEPGINAFVAGYTPNDTVLVVSQGALNNLSRDEMQGVIGHEFSHIFNSDMALNLHLMVVLGGLLGLSQMGNALIRRGKSAASACVGLILYVFGLIGVFFGNILRAAISRQRETLADASAVQYTRDPNGIVHALLKIKAQGQKALMNNTHAEEVNHMCFSVARDISPLGLFASHPKLERRIQMLDPTGEISAQFSEEVQQIPTKPETVKSIDAGAMLTNLAAGAIAASGQKIMADIGNPTKHNLNNAETFLHTIPANLMVMLNNSTAAQALVYAIAITSGRDIEALPIPINLPKEIQDLLAQCINDPGITNPRFRAALISLAIPSLKTLNDADKAAFLDNITSILLSNLTVHRALLLTILKKHLTDTSFQKPEIKYTDFTQIQDDVACIIWFLAQQSNEDPTLPPKIFGKGMQQLIPATKDFSTYHFNPEDLIISLTKLRYIAPNIKERFITACVTCIEEDGKINIPELEFLRAVCTCLDCPIPLLDRK